MSSPSTTPTPADDVLARHGLVLRTLAPLERGVDGADPARAEHPAHVRHTAAVEKGFYEEVPDGAAADQDLGVSADDAKVLRGVYLAEDDPARREPVGTFVDWASRLTTSPGAELPVWMISNVTVSPGHRRRGILRAMMTASLDEAVAAGVPVAALTASESTIYGRFGFGAACTGRTVRVDVRGDVVLAADAAGRGGEETGTVLREDPRALPGVVEELHDRVRRLTPGSVHRPTGHVVRWEDRSAAKNDGKGSGLFAAVHRDADGAVQGVALYRFDGWEKEPTTVSVEAFLAATDAAARQLWRYLTRLDLIDRLHMTRCPDDGGLEQLLADRRRVRTRSVWDDLYLRVLDVEACVAGRGYAPEVAGDVVLRVADAAGHAEGTWRLSVAEGAGRAARLTEDAPADLDLDVAHLSAVWLGGTRTGALVHAGVVGERTPGAAARLDALLTPAASVHLLTGF
ncbi:GNAT family N-acetyltransferase [Micrococcus luteus]|uniref:GNAT family N-acetyltransferase n=1 Tax=Micrococcus luteus TaxID=1270 RepID=UPI00097E946E|nr:GNAT family N-acetyltransferase [Micrococcus luteus]SJN21076.1 Enhanced intracellular survival protein [Micrococcus luteus Mu201]